MEHEGDNLDATAARQDKLRTNDGVGTIVAALDEHIGLQQFDQPQGGVFVEEDDTVDTAKGRDHPGAVELGDDRTIGSLPQSPRRGVAIEAHDQDRAKITRALEHFNVPKMHQVEHTVGEYHRRGGAATPGARIGEGPDLSGGRTAPAQSASSARGLKRIVTGP